MPKIASGKNLNITVWIDGVRYRKEILFFFLFEQEIESKPFNTWNDRDSVHNRWMSFIKGNKWCLKSFCFLRNLKVLCPHIEYKPLNQYQSNVSTSFNFWSQTAFAKLFFFFHFFFYSFIYIYICTYKFKLTRVLIENEKSWTLSLSHNKWLASILTLPTPRPPLWANVITAQTEVPSQFGVLAANTRSGSNGLSEKRHVAIDRRRYA